MREVFTGTEDVRLWLKASVENGEARVDFEYMCEDFIPNEGTITYSYTFDCENTVKLIAFFEKKYEGTLEEMVASAETEEEEPYDFEKTCQSNNIAYTRREHIVI